MNILALELINSYDKTKDEDFYQAAEKIIDKLLEWEENNSVEIINRLQLIKRKRNLTNEEINILYDIKNKENQREEIQYGISILLENKADIEYYYKQLSKEKKEQFSKLPIENLKNNIK